MDSGDYSQHSSKLSRKVMSSLLESISLNDTIRTEHTKDNYTNNNKYPRHVLKSKNIFKSKCNKVLKRKLKKYKLRKDGKEDQDVLDVSQTLLFTLKIKSPNNHTLIKTSENQDLRPKNYLFKMARRKQKSKPLESVGSSKSHKDAEVVCVSTTPENQDKKQTNAFKLLMDSRNKSLGTNSPGKEKTIEPSEVQEIIDKKNLKVKRTLALAKMAETKGSLKKKEREEYEEECIKRKMDARAERLKNMVTSNKKGKGRSLKHETVEGDTYKSVKEKDSAMTKTNSIEYSNNKNNVSKIPKTLQDIDIFSEDILCHDSTTFNRKSLLTEDEEFLKKLSPSIKKKENMLCYFTKIEKKSESCKDTEHDITENTGADVIKVKLTPKRKNKSRRKKLSLNKNPSNDILKDHNEINCLHDKTETLKTTSVEVECSSNSNERRKRKRKENAILIQTTEAETIGPVPSERRPKRQTKKPVKYIDDGNLSSSDEELVIFTPKKRKQIDIKTKHGAKGTVNKILSISDEESNERKHNCNRNIGKNIKIQKKPTKLAPIFAPKLTSKEIEAKQKFLHSGIPEKLKKIIANQKQDNTELSNNFHTVVHVQQKDATVIETLNQALPDFLDDNSDAELLVPEGFSLNGLTLHKVKSTSNNYIPLNNTHTALHNIKELYPKFPVYRTYRLLKSIKNGDFKNNSCPVFDNSIDAMNGILDTDVINENPDNLTWTNKYKATSTKHVIGNFESIKELKKWLISWTENESKPRNTATSSSDFSDFCDSETDSRDSLRTTNNLLIITGPVGSGKTSSVYTVAAELAIKVIEVNASSKRTGKVMLQDLQEATQSHKVNRGNGSAENSQKSQEAIECVLPNNIKKRGRPKKTTKNISVGKTEIISQPASQEGLRTGMSLILIDDSDIVFEQDEGFSSAVTQLIHSSKRPVILVTSSLSCPHLQRFVQCGRIISMYPFSPKMLGTWLDIMCLADNGTCWPGVGAQFLNLFRGDIRKAINALQFYITTQTQICTVDEQAASQNNDYYKLNTEDENSNMSWADSEVVEKNSISRTSVDVEEKSWKYIRGEQSDLLSYPLELFNVWWSVPMLLNDAYSNSLEGALNSGQLENKPRKQEELETIANVIDTCSFVDYLNIRFDNRSNITSLPWSSFGIDSVSELECMDTYNKSHEISDEISHELVTSAVVNAQITLKMENKTDIHFPGMAEERNKNRVISRHENFTSFLNQSSVLDRRALALDYWSSCRTICRIEKNRTDTSSKRRNRFCHYLKSFNVLCKNESYDKLGDSLGCEGKDESI